MLAIHQKYADLLIHYCLELKEGEKLFVSSSFLAEPLLIAVHKAALQAGGHVVFFNSFSEQERIFLTLGDESQLKWVNPFQQQAFETFDAFLSIRAPYNLKEDQNVPAPNRTIRQEAMKPVMQSYFNRTASGELKRSLCQFPTQASAQEAGMALSEYEEFVYNACFLNFDNPVDKWLEVRKEQQRIVDHLNKSKEVRYKGEGIDIQFSVEGRTWINSDGRNNMPSGEVFTGPVEESVNGHVTFTYPAIYMGHEVEDVRLEVKNGEVASWKASRGQEFLDYFFDIPGARRFGEVAIGTNYGIDRFTKNILFDEKIGGTIHMALGQSYIQTGGKNESTVHWDMIADMRNGGEIFTDGERIYQNGKFLI